ncbi:calcium-binding protein [Sulfitobacter sp.]|uniref:calcium-binding protein n=1 Tax=Sulfitobacter sp. TaxID=1903071 RepID=UPI003F6AEDB4
MTSGRTGTESLVGSDATNLMSGNNGNDMLSGGAGRNRLVGGSGVDTADYSWSSSPASVNLGTNAYQRTTARSTDSLIGIENVRGTAFNDRITGNNLNNALEGGVGNDVLSGMGGNDVLIGGAGVDTLLGGSGNDMLYADEDDALLDGGTGFDMVIVAGDFNDSGDRQFKDVEEIRLGDGGQTLVMDDQTEGIRLTGGNGDDRAEGGFGADSFQMGLGDDTIVADDKDALISGGRGTDTLELGNSVSGRTEFSGLADDQLLGVEIVNLTQDRMTVSFAQQTEAMTINGFAEGASDITGGAGDETINGGIGNDTIDGGAGDDLVNAGDGDDSVLGGSGNDTINAGGGDDTVDGGDGNDVVNAGAGNDYIAGGVGNDTVNFGTELDSNDTVSGGAGTGDTLNFTDNGTGTDDLDNVTGFEYINVGDAPTDVNTIDSLVASGTTLHVEASGLSAANHFIWDGSAELDGKFDIESGAGNDYITVGAGDDAVLSGAGNDTIVGGRGADILNGGAGADEFIFSDGDQDFGRSTGIDTLQNFNPEDDTIVFADWVDRDINTARLMFEAATLGANEGVSSGSELLVVTNSSVSGSGDVAQSIATALEFAFDVTSIAQNAPSRTAGTVADSEGAQVLRFAVRGDGHNYWIGEYKDSGFDDTISRSDVKVLGSVETGTGSHFTLDQVLQFFEQPAEEAPQGLTLNLPADTGHSDTDPLYTTNQTVSVTGLESGYRLVYTVDGTNWATFAADVTSFTLDEGTYDTGDIQVRQVDLYGNFSAPAKTDANDVTVVVDRAADTVALVAEPNALVTDTVTVNWSNTRTSDAPLVSNMVNYRVDSGSWQTKDIAVDATSAALGTFESGTVEWYIRNEDAAGNVETSETDSFDVSSVIWDEDAPGLSEGWMPFVSLGIYEVSTYDGLPYYIGVGGKMPAWDIQTSGIMFDFDPKSAINADVWANYDNEVAGGELIIVNTIKVHDLDNKLGDYSGGLRDLSNFWYDTDDFGILKINMDDVSQDEGSTAPETRLQIDLDIPLVGGGVENYVIDVYVDWAFGIG